jgi:DnaA N-terminal domain
MASGVELIELGLAELGLGGRAMSTNTLPDQKGPAQLAAQWARIRGRLQQEVGEIEYRTWLRQMTLAGCEGDEIELHLPTRFLRDWVREHYADRLSTLWQAENPAVRRKPSAPMVHRRGPMNAGSPKAILGSIPAVMCAAITVTIRDWN